MQVTKEQVGPCTIALDFRIEPEVVSNAYNRAYKEFGRHARVPGFRPGKAPRAVLENFVNQESLRERVMELVAQPAYRDALKENDITAYADPEVEFGDLEDGQEWTFKAVVPMPPQVTLGEYADIAVERPIYTVTDEDVERDVEALRGEHARMVNVTDRPVQAMDVLIADVTVQMEGDETPAESRRSLVRLGDNIPGFDEAVIGMKEEEERTFELPYPEDWQDADRAGKKAKFTIKVSSINERVLPDLTDEWVAGVAPFKTVDELKENIRKHAEERAKSASDDVAEARIVDALVSRATIDFPQVMVEEEVENDLHELGHELERRSMSYEQYLEATQQTQEQHQGELARVAEERVKRTLVLREIAKQQNLDATNEELVAAWGRIVGQGDMDENQVRRLMRDPRNQTRVANSVIQAKIREHLFNTVKITDVPAAAE